MTDPEFIQCLGCGAPIAVKIIHTPYVESFAGRCECGWKVSGTKVKKMAPDVETVSDRTVRCLGDPLPRDREPPRLQRVVGADGHAEIVELPPEEPVDVT